MGQKFWSEEFTSQDTAVNIVSAMAQVSVSGSGLPQSELKVYLFSETGLFLDQYQRTDDSGQVMFRLPEGKYKFRADYEGSQFWSHISELAPDIVNPVDISVGGGQFVFQARTDTGDSISGSKCYVFTENKSYIGLYSATDENGEAFFDLADGIYLFRLDYMGEQFWSEPITIPDQLSYQMALGHKVAQITVKTKNEIVPNTKVYLFSETNQYLGKYQKTNDNGMVSFLLPVGMKYLFRADVSGTHQWSDLVQISDAGTNLIDLDAGGGQFMITLQKDDLTPISGIKMYLFTDTGSYTGQYKKTDAAGQVAFEVPDGDFKIRADYRGYQFWTDVEIITDDRIIDLTLPHYNTQINLKRHYQGAYDPLTGIKMYLFNPSGSYLGQYEMTDTDGNVKFSLPDREYKVRADYMGNKFWTEPFQSLDTDMTIYHGIAQVKVIRSGIPVPNIKTYLFNDNGSYLGQYSSTDENGFAEFTVPANHSYKFRVDVNGQRYWSDSVNIIENQKTPAEVEVD
ncbi:MAG: hypothetical protein GY857_14895 [Desulfobacula sp.]|nr:hypothetical protein [Desulfobacula sp.]